MTNEEILNKAIKKAIEGGMSNDSSYKKMIKDGSIALLARLDSYRNTIFSHDFAKSFFGRKRMGTVGPQEWSYHLQQMVIESEPLKYLEKFL